MHVQIYKINFLNLRRWAEWFINMQRHDAFILALFVFAVFDSWNLIVLKKYALSAAHEWCIKIKNKKIKENLSIAKRELYNTMHQNVHIYFSIWISNFLYIVFFSFNITNIKIYLIRNSLLKQCLLECAW